MAGFVKSWRIPFRSMPLLRFHDARIQKKLHHFVVTPQPTSPASLSRITSRRPIVQASASIYHPPPPTQPHLLIMYPPRLSANASHTPTFQPSPPSTTLTLLYRLHFQSLLNVHASLIPPFPVAASILKTNRRPRDPAPRALWARYPSQTVQIQPLGLVPLPSTMLVQWTFPSQNSTINVCPAMQAAVIAALRSVAALLTTSDVPKATSEVINPARTNRPLLSLWVLLR